MELRHVRCFVTVAETLHFGRAAAQLGMSQPPLSQQIRLLEREIGVPLLVRTSRRVALTEAGALFLEEARRTLAQADRAIDVARRAARGELGEVAIGFSPSVPLTGSVARALSAFRTRYPDVRLNLSEMTRAGQIAALAADRIAIGLVRGLDPPHPAPPVVATLLMTEPLLVALPGDHPLAAGTTPLTVAQLRGEAFIHYAPDLGAGFNEQFAELCARAGFVPDVVQEVTGPATLLGLVAAGLGISVIARSLGHLHPDDVVLRPLDTRAAVTRLWMMHRPGLSPAAAHFAGLLRADAPPD